MTTATITPPGSDKYRAAVAEFDEAHRRARLVESSPASFTGAEFNAAKDAAARAAAHVAALERAEQDAANRAALAELRAAAAPLLDQAATDLKTAEAKLTKACAGAQAALDAASSAADAYETVRAHHAAALGAAGVRIPTGAVEDGTDGVAVRVKGRWYLPAPAATVLAWLGWRTAPPRGVMSPPPHIGRLLYGAWTRDVPPTARREPTPPAAVSRLSLRDLLGPTAAGRADERTGFIVDQPYGGRR